MVRTWGRLIWTELRLDLQRLNSFNGLVMQRLALRKNNLHQCKNFIRPSKTVKIWNPSAYFWEDGKPEWTTKLGRFEKRKNKLVGFPKFYLFIAGNWSICLPSKCLHHEGFFSCLFLLLWQKLAASTTDGHDIFGSFSRWVTLNQSRWFEQLVETLDEINRKGKIDVHSGKLAGGWGLNSLCRILDLI